MMCTRLQDEAAASRIKEPRMGGVEDHDDGEFGKLIARVERW